jgi:hypothetical protein
VSKSAGTHLSQPNSSSAASLGCPSAIIGLILVR